MTTSEKKYKKNLNLNPSFFQKESPPTFLVFSLLHTQPAARLPAPDGLILIFSLLFLLNRRLLDSLLSHHPFFPPSANLSKNAVVPPFSSHLQPSVVPPSSRFSPLSHQQRLLLPQQQRRSSVVHHSNAAPSSSAFSAAPLIST